jgi:hypothetical protein
MATYSVSDLIGKTLTIKRETPAYANPTRKGEKKGKPLFFLDAGDSFTVDSYLTQTGTYTNYATNYLIAAKTTKYPKGFYVELKDLSNNVDESQLKTQGVKSDKEKETDKQPFIQKITTQYLPYILGGIAAIIIIPKVLKRK